jgi:hypothetical protein|nr:MAG TPA: hypothetical protein [Caudoviricetes sp.]
MAKKVGIGYSFKEKSLKKENEELRAKIKELQEKADKKAETGKGKKADKKAE